MTYISSEAMVRRVMATSSSSSANSRNAPLLDGSSSDTCALARSSGHKSKEHQLGGPEAKVGCGCTLWH
jgi:hypothetical protein